MKKVENNKKISLDSSITKILLRSVFLLSLLIGDKAKANNFDCTSLEQVPSSGDCAGMYIATKAKLEAAVSDNSYTINHNGVDYTFGNDANNIYTGNITDFSGLFKNKRTFNENIGYWNTASATNMKEMFRGARAFNQDLSNWDLTNVTDMSGMFRDARSFNNGGSSQIIDWETGNVTNMSTLFRNARAFNQPLNRWDTEAVTNMNSIFRGAWIFNGKINDWKTQNVKNFAQAFRDARAFNKDITNWDVGSATRMNRFLYDNNAFNQDLSAWDVSNVKENNAEDFAPNLASAKKPCWGFDGCAELGNTPVLNSYSPNGFNISDSDDTQLILNFDRAVKVKGGKSNIQLWKKENDGKYTKHQTFNLTKSEDITDKETTTNITINIGKYLEDDTEYFIRIPNNTILSESTDTPFPGRLKKYHQAGSLAFSTGSDVSPLTFIGSSPAIGTNKLEVSEPKIELRFSEGIAFGSGSISLMKYDDQTEIRGYDISNSTDLKDIKIDNDILTINLIDTNGDSLIDLETKYYLTIDATAIDNAGDSKSYAGTIVDGSHSKDLFTYTSVDSEVCGSIKGKAKYWQGREAVSTTVKIYKEETLVATETTNSLGNYEYYPTSSGTYNVEFVKPDNNSRKLTRANIDSSSTSSSYNSGRWVRNIIISSDCLSHREVDGLLIDPQGIIFDSNTRQPISGVTVNLLYNGELVNNDWLDSSGGNNSQITGSDGEYSFIFKADTALDGTYTIEVLPPTAYKFESTLIPAETNVYSSQLGGGIEEIQPQDTAPASDQDTTYYLSFDFVFTNVAASTSNGVVNNHIPIDAASDPTLKADVKGLVEAWTDAAIRFNKSSVKAVNKRFNWLRSNQNSEKKSHQGINISFANPLLEMAFNGSTKRFKDLDNRDLESWARSNWSNERLKNESDQVFNELINNSVNLAFAELRDKTSKPNLNPRGGELIGNWSLWSNGEILIGNVDSSSNSSGQDTNSFYLTLGIDKPYKENNLFGMAFTYGEDDISVGNLGSGINSTNLGFNFYSSNLLKNKFPLETQIGFGKMNMNSKRIDNSTSHKGNRDVYMIFGSAKILAEPLKIKNFQLTPYGRLDLAHIHLKAFSESGSSLALTFKDQTVNRKMVSLGLNLDRDLIFENWRLKPFLGISYGYDFTGDSIVDMNYVGDSQNYRIILDKLSSEQWTTSLGFEFYRNNNWSVSISYDYQNSDSYSYSNSYQFNISWFF